MISSILTKPDTNDDVACDSFWLVSKIYYILWL